MSVRKEILLHLNANEKKILFGRGPATWGKIDSYVNVNLKNERDDAKVVRHLKRAAKNIEKTNAIRKKSVPGAWSSHTTSVPLTRDASLAQKSLQKNFVVHHNKQSPMTKIISLSQWNNMNYSPIQRSSSRWPRAMTQTTPTNLYDAIWTHTNGSSVVMFHGTIARFEKSILSNILWRKSDGVLGKGFYLTHNPNIAKAYACRAKVLAPTIRPNEHCIVLEIIVKNAKQIKRVMFDDKEFAFPNVNTTTFVLNTEKNFDGQLCLRGTIGQHLTIKRVHVFECNTMQIRGTDLTEPLQTGC